MFGARRWRSAAIRADHRRRGSVGNRQLFVQAIVARHRFGIAAKQNVRAAAGHVRGNRDRALAPGLRDDFRFALVLLGVQHLVRDARLLQQFARCSDFSMEIVPTSTGWPAS